MKITTMRFCLLLALVTFGAAALARIPLLNATYPGGLLTEAGATP